MKFFALARLSSCLLLCLSPALLGHCGGATNTGEPGTETGNPPRVDAQKLRLVATAAGAELTGQPGAVSPGASVRLENRSTGAAAEVTVGADGSFRLQVAGGPLDTYEATVRQQGRAVPVPVSATTPDGLVPNSELSTLACQQLENALGERLDLAFAPSARGCTSDSECVIQYWGLGCYYQCGFSYVLGTQQEAAVAVAEQSIAPVCTELERRCERQPPSSCPGGARPFECYQGSCRALSLDEVSCEDISTRAGQGRAAMIDAADRGCTRDTDCALVTAPLTCRAGCSDEVSVAASAVQTLRNDLARVEALYCSAFENRPCPPPLALPCVPNPGTPNAVCQQGLCGIEFATELP